MNPSRPHGGTRWAAALLAASLGSLATPAWAEATASATMALQISLVDDNPNDAIAPSISFANGVDSWLRLVGSVAQANFEAVQLAGSGPFGAVAGTLGRPLYDSQATLSGAGTATLPWLLTTAGLARGGGGAFDTLLSVPTDHGSFTLSAYTTVTFAAAVSLQVDVTGGNGAEGASAGAYLMLQGPGGRLEDAVQRAVDAQDLGAGQFAGASASATRQFSLSLTNAGPTDQTGLFYAAVNTVGQSAVSPVPEPAAITLMLAGLGLLGVRRMQAGPRAAAPLPGPSTRGGGSRPFGGSA